MISKSKGGLVIEWIGLALIVSGVYMLSGVGWALLFLGLFVAIEGHDIKKQLR